MTDSASAASMPFMKKAFARITIFVFLLYIINFLDRVNIGYAIAGGMFTSLGIPKSSADTVAGLASAIFFVAYFIPQIFSNLGITRVGVRKIFTVTFTAWGIITIATGFVSNVPQVYALRFILGLAEAPFFAGVVLYLSMWFPKKERGAANGIFMAAIPIAGIVGSLLAGAIFSAYGASSGWRFLFYYEGILALVSVAFIWFLMTDFPKQAKWLSDSEKKTLIDELDKENVEKKGQTDWKKALKDPDVLKLTLVYLLGVTSLYGYVIWLPSVLKAFGSLSSSTASYLSAIPFIIASISLVFISRYSDKSGKRKMVTFAVFATAFLGLVISALTLSVSAVVSMIFFVIAAIGIFSFLPSFWTIPTEFLSGESSASSIGLINATGNLGGIIGPVMVGFLASTTGSFLSGVYAMAVFSLIGGLVTLTIKKSR
ncbi:MAG: MFS transporter [Candidatus Thermoplasmatota archaeon]|nr:MFS transporter [Candidatus Thermoplasmatota archaeon]